MTDLTCLRSSLEPRDAESEGSPPNKNIDYQIFGPIKRRRIRWEIPVARLQEEGVDEKCLEMPDLYVHLAPCSCPPLVCGQAESKSATIRQSWL
jgi:hypothetical protein